MFQRFYFAKDIDEATLNVHLRDARLQFIGDIMRQSSILATDTNIHITVTVRKVRNRAKDATQDIYLLTGRVFI